MTSYEEALKTLSFDSKFRAIWEKNVKIPGAAVKFLDPFQKYGDCDKVEQVNYFS